MQRVYTQIAWAAHSGAPVLITGQTGTGKDLAARALSMGAATRARDPSSPRSAGGAGRERAVRLCEGGLQSDWTNNRNYAYGYDFQFLGNSRKQANGRFINFPVRLTRLVSSRTVLAADCLGTAAGKPAAARTAYRVTGSGDTTAVGNHGWALDPPRLRSANSDYCDDSNRADPHRSAPDTRHRGRANVSFCDGHVESLTLGDLGYQPNADGSVAARGGRAHNRLFSGSGQDDDPPPIN